MKRWGMGLGAVVLGLALLGAAPAGKLEAVSYHRTGGFAGTNDTLTVTPAGEAKTSGKLFGKRAGKLTAAQMARLGELFAGFEKFKGKYPSPAGMRDGFVVDIGYGARHVEVGDGAENVPEGLTKLRTELETLVATLPKAEG